MSIELFIFVFPQIPQFVIRFHPNNHEKCIEIIITPLSLDLDRYGRIQSIAALKIGDFVRLMKDTIENEVDAPQKVWAMTREILSVLEVQFSFSQPPVLY
jgi:hypothetical protein